MNKLKPLYVKSEIRLLFYPDSNISDRIKAVIKSAESLVSSTTAFCPKCGKMLTIVAIDDTSENYYCQTCDYKY